LHPGSNSRAYLVLVEQEVIVNLPAAKWLRVAPIVLAFIESICAAQPQYEPRVEKWLCVTVPPASSVAEREAWSYAANYSPHHWYLFVKDAAVYASLDRQIRDKPAKNLRFEPRAGDLTGVSAVAFVADGCLVGFNEGEWGGALYWFSPDGKRSYRISDHQVVDFIKVGESIYAIEGLTHLTSSEGSVIHITRSNDRARWESRKWVKLPAAPEAVTLTRDNLMLITLSNALVSVDTQCKIEVLVQDAPWQFLYPSWSLLSADGERLYIGMRQYFGEFTIKTKQMRMLLPNNEFLNSVPKDAIHRLKTPAGNTSR
jgi:hypothetical protein